MSDESKADENGEENKTETSAMMAASTGELNVIYRFVEIFKKVCQSIQTSKPEIWDPRSVEFFQNHTRVKSRSWSSWKLGQDVNSFEIWIFALKKSSNQSRTAYKEKIGYISQLMIFFTSF